MSIPETLQEQLEEQLSRVARLRFRQDETLLPEQLLALAQLHGMAEQHALAKKAYEEAQPLLRKRGLISEQAEAILGQAVATLHEGDAKEALLLLNDALVVYREAKDVVGEGGCHAAAAEICRGLGDDEAARDGFLAALEHFRKGHAHGREARILMDLGDLEMVAGRYAEARAYFEESLPIAEEHLDAEQVAQCALLLGEAAGLQGDHVRARSALERALPHYAQHGPAPLHARAAWDLGLSLYYLGALDAAEASLRIAQTRYHEAGHVDEVTRCDQAIAQVHKKRGGAGPSA